MKKINFHFSSLILFVLFTVLNTSFVFAQKNAVGYKIKVKINGLAPNSECKLVRVKGDVPEQENLAKTNDSSIVVFEGKKTLTGAFYYCILPGEKYFNFIIDKNQHFEVETNLKSLGTQSYKNSEENTAYIQYFADLKAVTKEHNDMVAVYKEAKEGSKKREKAEEVLKKLKQKPKEIKQAFYEKYPDALATLFFKSHEKVSVPKKPDSLAEMDDKVYIYRYYMSHFWDNFDLTDSRTLSLSTFQPKLVEFMEKRTVKQADSIIKSADVLMNKVKENKDLFQYVVTWITSKYFEPKMMGEDAIFVHMIDKWHTPEYEKWLGLDEATLLRLRAKAKKHRPALIGKTAANIIAPDKDGKEISMYNIEADYKLLFFFSAGCDHCQAATPGVIKLYNDFKDRNVAVFALCTDDHEDDWPKYLSKLNPPFPTTIDLKRKSKFYNHYDLGTLPDFYLVDKDHKIIAKGLNEKQMYDELKKLFEYLDKAKE